MCYFRTCPNCGAHLDPGEHCDCDAQQIERQDVPQAEDHTEKEAV